MRALPVFLAAIVLEATIGLAAAQNIRIALQDDPDTLDPAKNWTFVGRHVLASLCDKLVELAPDGSIVPMLATFWTTAEAGRSATFALRPGVPLHHAAQFDA